MVHAHTWLGVPRPYVEAKIIELIFQNRCHSEHHLLANIIFFHYIVPAILSCHCQLERTFVVANNHQPKCYAGKKM